jgi:hypothetical protein
MSKPSSSSKKKQREDIRARRPASDRTVYAALIIIGTFAVLLAIPLTGGKQVGAIAVGYVAAMAWLVNQNAFRAYRGMHLANWQAALARLPLRCAGFGAKGHKPLEAAKGQPAARTWLMVSIVVSILLVLGLLVLLVPEARLWG